MCSPSWGQSSCYFDWKALSALNPVAVCGDCGAENRLDTGHWALFMEMREQQLSFGLHTPPLVEEEQHVNHVQPIVPGALADWGGYNAPSAHE